MPPISIDNTFGDGLDFDLDDAVVFGFGEAVVLGFGETGVLGLREAVAYAAVALAILTSSPATEAAIESSAVYNAIARLS